MSKSYSKMSVNICQPFFWNYFNSGNSVTSQSVLLYYMYQCTILNWCYIHGTVLHFSLGMYRHVIWYMYFRGNSNNMTQITWHLSRKQSTVKPVLKGHSKVDKTKILMTNGSIMKVESIAECSPWSILHHFWPALSDNWSWKRIFGLFESGRFRQVLL